jgi:outer membrane receptor protein involved in Fe transport
MMGNPSSSYTWPDKTSNRMGFLNLKGSHWLSDNDQMVGNVYYRRANSSNVNSNASLDGGCFDAFGNLATTTSGNVTTYQCANQAPNGTAVNAVTGANALALGYGDWTRAIHASLVDSATHQNTVGSALQWSNFDDLLGHKNTFTLGGLVDQSRINYQQNTYLAQLINYQTVITPNQTYGFTPNGAAPSSSNLPSFTGSNQLSAVNLASTTRDVSVYFTDTTSLTDKLNVTGSGSFNYTSIQQSGDNATYLNGDGGYTWTDNVSGVSYYNPGYVNAYTYSNTGTGASPTPNGIPGGAVAGPQINGLDGAHHYRRFNPALGFNYNFDAANGIFGGYSEAMRAPTSIELSCANPNSPCALPTGFNGDPDLQAVVAKTVEFGARGRFNDKASWNAAVYDSRLSNDIQFIATSSTYGYFANVGDTERRGVELGAQTQLNKLFLSGNYGYVNAIYKSAFTTAAGESVVSGNKIPGIPSTSFKLRAAYAASPAWLLGANVVVVGDQYSHGNESNTDPNGKVPGYKLVNLDLHYKVNQELKLSVYVNNLFNKQYATYGLSGMTSVYTLATQQFVTPAPPRAMWVGLTYSFGGKTPSKALGS